MCYFPSWGWGIPRSVTALYLSLFPERPLARAFQLQSVTGAFSFSAVPWAVPTLCHCPQQVGKNGHCSVEDARSTMELYKIVEAEWEQHLMLNSEQE